MAVITSQVETTSTSPNLWPERPARMRPAFEACYGDYLPEKILSSRLAEEASP